MVEWLATKGFEVNRKRVRRLMEAMGIEAVYAKLKLSVPAEGHRIYPYLLRDEGKFIGWGSVQQWRDPASHLRWNCRCILLRW